MSFQNTITELIQSKVNIDRYKELHWEGTFWEYLELVKKDPKIARSSFERIYDMIKSYGVETYTEFKKKITHYTFFDDPIENGKDSVFGLDFFFSTGAVDFASLTDIIITSGLLSSNIGLLHCLMPPQ